MFTQNGRMKAQSPLFPWVNRKAVGEVKALIITLVILFTITMNVSAAAISAPVCNPDAFCAAISQPQPNWFAPQLVTSATTLVQSGPGANFDSYGELPAGFISRVTGISEDGDWWVIPLPSSITKDGKGWVKSTTVTTDNVQAMPDWLKNCDPLDYCGYILAHSPQYVPVRRASS